MRTISEFEKGKIRGWEEAAKLAWEVAKVTPESAANVAAALESKAGEHKHAE